MHKARNNSYYTYTYDQENIDTGHKKKVCTKRYDKLVSYSSKSRHETAENRNHNNQEHLSYRIPDHPEYHNEDSQGSKYKGGISTSSTIKASLKTTEKNKCAFKEDSKSSRLRIKASTNTRSKDQQSISNGTSGSLVYSSYQSCSETHNKTVSMMSEVSSETVRQNSYLLHKDPVRKYDQRKLASSKLCLQNAKRNNDIGIEPMTNGASGNLMHYGNGSSCLRHKVKLPTKYQTLKRDNSVSCDLTTSASLETGTTEMNQDNGSEAAANESIAYSVYSSEDDSFQKYDEVIPINSTTKSERVKRENGLPFDVSIKFLAPEEIEKRWAPLERRLERAIKMGGTNDNLNTKAELKVTRLSVTTESHPFKKAEASRGQKSERSRHSQI